MTLYLAVDGGNSKTDVLIGTAGGEVLASARGPGTCHQNIGLIRTMARLNTLVSKVRRDAGLADGIRLDHAEVYLAGADLPPEVDLLTHSVAEADWAGTIRLDNDTFALLRAGTDAADAVAVVCGAGINCVGRAAGGRSARFPSLGSLSGDWGGGGHLATLALWHAVRGEDGRGPATALSAAVAGHFGLSTAEDVGGRMHLGTLDRARLDELTPLLFDVASQGDPVAQRVVAKQVNEIVALVTVAARRLDLLDLPFVVVLGGGVLRARHPILVDPVTERVLAAAPKASVTVVQAPPVLGAALHALDAIGASPAAHDALRGAFA